MFDNRDKQFSLVNKAEFTNTALEIIKVYYTVTNRREDYTYDASGNRRTEKTTLNAEESRTYEYYPNSSRLMTNGKYAFVYDANGNLIEKGSSFTVENYVVSFNLTQGEYWKYTYDLLNRLNKVAKNGQVIAEYLYDESGLRIQKTGADGIVNYVFDTAGNLLYEQENRDYLEYIYVLGKHFARIDGNLGNSITKKYFYHTDHLGSTVLVTDETGQTVWASEYTPFGGKHSVDGELDHAAKFTGKDLDEDTGLYYFNARWYDGEVGRFISEDPAKDENNPNLFVYCRNNPIIFTDLSGLKAIMEAHGLNSNKDMWDNLNEELAKKGDVKNGGYIDMKEAEKSDPNNNFGFHNEGLFNKKEMEKIRQVMENSDLTPEQKKDYLRGQIQSKIATLDKNEIDVMIAVNFSNNQDDFRKQGAELKEAIDFVNPEGMKVDVLAHSMGSLATASYIAGISGVNFEHDIDQFIALGPPFAGNGPANFARGLNGGMILPSIHGSAYRNLKKGSPAIKQLQEAWNNNWSSYGVQAYALQSSSGDGIVSPGSSFSLKGITPVIMPYQLHTLQADDRYWQEKVYNLLQ